MSEILKPCPFCGNEAEMIVQWSEEARCDGYAVRCRSCFTRSGLYTSEQQAAEKWNRRSSPANEPLTLEQLREMDGKPVWWWNTTDKPRLTICCSALYNPDILFISYDWIEEDSTGITPYKKIIKWGYKPYAHEPGKDGDNG